MLRCAVPRSARYASVLSPVLHRVRNVGSYNSSSLRDDHFAAFSFMDTLRQIEQNAIVSTKKAKMDPLNHGAEGEVAATHSAMLLRQLQLEDKQHADAVKDYTESLSKLMQNGNASGLKHIQVHALSWYHPLVREIEAEKMLVRMKIPGSDRDPVGTVLLMLPIEKLAVVTINTTLNQVLRLNNTGVPVRQLCLNIGKLLSIEFNVLKAQQGSQFLTKWQKEQIKLARGNERRVQSLSRRLFRLTNDEWDSPTCIHLGSLLFSMLMQCARTAEGLPCFSKDISVKEAGSPNLLSRIRMNDNIYHDILHRNLDTLMPQYLPMLVPPKPWVASSQEISGGYYRLDTELVRTKGKAQKRGIMRAGVPGVLESLDYLSQCKWRINKRIYEVIREAYKNNDTIGELPNRNNQPVPTLEEYRPIFAQEASVSPDASDEEYAAAELKSYKKMVKLVEKTNAELHSLRCDIDIKMNIAKNFYEDIMYFPCNMDFRGRVYPVPPNLNHLGSDLCRGLLTFAEPKALGPNGLQWLKIHLCNLFGNNKISLNDREKWVDENMSEVIDSAASPLTGRRWWATAESPFQALSCCIEIKAAVDSGDPASFMSCLPVHQDGSCNGLQHYAALGRDAPGALAVNLVSGEQDKPGDVYSTVLAVVRQKIAADASMPDSSDAKKQQKKEFAVMLNGRVDRKVIKQSVMTSVYGVTLPGARDQILSKLLDIAKKDLNGAPMSPEILSYYTQAAMYLAQVTLHSLGQIFSSADKIMKWLGDLANLTAKQGQLMSWITPLGLPVFQPYRKSKNFVVETVLQNVMLVSNDENLPVCPRKQKTAFPPNFVHSLDATHMLLTALKMKEKGLTFAAVHDSYWTYPCDIPVMGDVLRSAFVDVYSQSVLENLLASCQKRFPHVNFPPIPARGELDINSVLSSRYFFH